MLSCLHGLYLFEKYRNRHREKLTLSHGTCEERALALKDWQRFKCAQSCEEFRLIDIAVESQVRALDELRQESEELYQKCIQVCVGLYNYEYIMFYVHGRNYPVINLNLHHNRTILIIIQR